MIRGVLVGLSVAVPIGPNALLCMNRVMGHGLRGGFLTGLGTAIAHALYSALAIGGIVAVSIPGMRPLGALALVWMAVRAVRRPSEGALPQPAQRLLVSSLGFALTNPMTIVSFGAVFAGSGPITGGIGDMSLLVAGVFIGSALWWMVLSAVATMTAQYFSGRMRRRLDYLSALLLLGLGGSVAVT